jgi:hypothetical protein
VIAEVRPTKQLLLQAKAHDRWLASARDGLYNAGGTLPVRDGTGSSGTHIGKEIDLQASWAAAPGVQIAGGVGHIFPGRFLQRSTPGAS